MQLEVEECVCRDGLGLALMRTHRLHCAHLPSSSATPSSLLRSRNDTIPPPLTDDLADICRGKVRLVEAKIIDSHVRRWIREVRDV